MQTWLVHMRHPVKLYKVLGPGSFWGFQFFVGFSSFTFLTAPLLWVMAGIWWLMIANPTQDFLPQWLFILTMTNLLMNFVSHWVMMLICTTLDDRANARYRVAAVLYPFYLVLHSVASYKALYQLIVKPHFWEKTTHGLVAVKRLT